jgi:uncharacterized protein DUF5696
MSPACSRHARRAGRANSSHSAQRWHNAVAETTPLENDDLRIDIAVEPTLHIRVTDKRSGAVWECPGAPFGLHYWDAPHFSTRVCPVDHDAGWEFRVIPDDHKIGVQCTWPRAACGFRVVFTLDGPALLVSVPGRRVVENRGFDVRPTAIDILPRFGAVQTGQPGFVLVPKGRGVVWRFDKADRLQSEMLFYARDPRGLNAPVFGLARESGGLLAIAAAEEFDAELVMCANAGPRRDLNGAHLRTHLRFHSADPLREGDSVMRYEFLQKDDATTLGMAHAYRRFLTEVQGEAPLSDRLARLPMLDYARRAVFVHLLIAEKRKQSRATGDGELEIKTRFAEVPEIAQKLRAAGIEDAVLIMAGWNCEGRDGLYPTRFPVEHAAGGADAMEQAIRDIDPTGYEVGALDNYGDMYRRSPVFNDELSAKQLGGEHWRGGVWAGGQSYVICPQQALERHVQRDLRRLRDLGLEGLLFLDHCPGPGVLQCRDPDHPLTRGEYAACVKNIITGCKNIFGACQVSSFSVFAALTADACVCPVEDLPFIDGLEPEWYVDQAVPFLPIALHGVVLMTADADADPLRVIEYGAVPAFTTTTTDSGRDAERIAAIAKRFGSELAPLVDQFIESHQETDEGLIRVGYSNGAAVLINRTDERATIDGVAVEAQSFHVQQ